MRIVLKTLATRRSAVRLGGIIALAALFVWALLTFSPMETLQTLDTASYTAAAATFFGVMVFVTVVAPFAILPAVPAVALVLGPLETALLSVTGWTLGAVIAFLIAQHLGRPLLAKLVSMEQLERYERAIPADTTFWGLIVLRMLVPVDILSYAIGLVSRMRIVPYTLATAIGVTPFSFIFAYAGHAAVTGEYTIVAIGIGVVALALLFAYRSIRLRRRQERNGGA